MAWRDKVSLARLITQRANLQGETDPSGEVGRKLEARVNNGIDAW